MKVSLNLMKFYSDAAQWKLPVAELAKKIGAQLGAVEETIDLAGKYDNVFVADIVAAKEHPRADKLGVYQLNVGEVEPVQVLAGDKTLKVGDKVAWIKPGATVPLSWGTAEPFVIGARDMRGLTSNGMLGSGKELDMNDDHTSVQVLDTDAPAGTLLADAYHLDDAIIDIENKMFTHRPDGFGHLGVAREIAGIQNVPFTSPDWYSLDATLPAANSNIAPLTVKNEIPKLVPRYVAITLDGVKVAPSPLWLQATLHKLGIRPINNIVDITNYIMVLTGQPLHAFDYDKVAGQTIVVRKPQDGEKLELLDGRTIEPHKDAMLICDAEKPIGLGGMMGGGNSEITESTTRIVLECATFDMFTIRRSSMQHGVFTDAVTRFSKGQSPLQNVAIAVKAIEDIQKLAGGHVGAVIDNSHVKETVGRGSVHAPVVTTADFINSRIGTNLSVADIAVLLGNVECRVEEHGNELIVTPPFWRTDIEIPEDVVEEVGRLHSYDAVPVSLPTRETLAVELPAIDELKARIREILARGGANELQTYTFVPAKLMKQVSQDPTKAFAIRNALSPELEHYRMSLTPGLLDKVHANIKAGYKQFGIFETNKIHIKDDVAKDCDGLPREYQTVAFVFASDSKMPGAAFYYAKKYLSYLLEELGVAFHVTPVEQAPGFEVGRQVFAPFEQKRAGYVFVGGEDFAGFVGEYRGAVAKNLKLPQTIAGFEIDLERLLKHARGVHYRPLLKFPATDQDVCLKVASTVTYGQLEQLVREHLPADERLRVTISPLDIYQREDDAAHVQITFRLALQHHDRTLTTSEVNDMLDTLVQKIDTAIGAERI
jgi:phenylalanyl-tRNA synthetase beta chain